jgi:hypothetical protein
VAAGTSTGGTTHGQYRAAMLKHLHKQWQCYLQLGEACHVLPGGWHGASELVKLQKPAKHNDSEVRLCHSGPHSTCADLEMPEGRQTMSYHHFCSWLFSSSNCKALEMHTGIATAQLVASRRLAEGPVRCLCPQKGTPQDGGES